jgi:hypothetical protein
MHDPGLVFSFIAFNVAIGSNTGYNMILRSFKRMRTFKRMKRFKRMRFFQRMKHFKRMINSLLSTFMPTTKPLIINQEHTMMNRR